MDLLSLVWAIPVKKTPSDWPVGFQFSAQQPLQAINYDDMLERIYFETLTHMHHVYVHWKKHVEFSILSNKTIAVGSEQKKMMC